LEFGFKVDEAVLLIGRVYTFGFTFSAFVRAIEGVPMLPGLSKFW